MQTQVSTQVINNLTITMSEDEWRQALVNPVPLMARVRKELQAFHKDAPIKAKLPKARDGGHRKHKVGKSECPHCKGVFSNVGIARHIRKCAGTAAMEARPEDFAGGAV